MYNKIQFLIIVKEYAGLQKWHNGNYNVSGTNVGIKQFGKWIQIIQIGENVRDSISEKPSRKKLIDALDEMLSKCGIKS